MQKYQLPNKFHFNGHTIGFCPRYMHNFIIDSGSGLIFRAIILSKVTDNSVNS